MTSIIANMVDEKLEPLNANNVKHTGLVLPTSYVKVFVTEHRKVLDYSISQ